MRYGIETFGIFVTELHDPTIIGARVSSSQFWILHRTFPKNPQGRIENGDIDLFVVHDLEARFRVVATSRRSLGVGYLATGEQLFTVHADPTNGAEIAAHALTLVRFVINDEIFVPSAIYLNAKRTIAVLRINV